MHTVRVYVNRHEGAIWWAEDDLGFTGGADRLSDLVGMIYEWAGAEGVLDDLGIRLVGDPPAVPAVNPFSVIGLNHPGSAGTHGVLRVEPVMIAVREARSSGKAGPGLSL